MYKVLLNTAMTSVAKDCIIPVQDHLGLGNECRMNQPGTVGFNWRWRLLPGQVTDELAEEIKDMSIRANRANWDAIHAAEEAEEAE
jgi:4-alpha-glucanotransferase